MPATPLGRAGIAFVYRDGMVKVWGLFRQELRAWQDVVGPYRHRGYLLFLLLCLSAVAETLSIGSVLPLLTSIIQDPAGNDHGRLMGWASGLQADTRLLVASGLVVGLFLFRSAIALTREYLSLIHISLQTRSASATLQVASCGRTKR